MNLKEKLKLYIENNFEDEKDFLGSQNIALEDASMLLERATFARASKKKNIDSYLDDHKNYSDFQTMLFNLIDERGLKDSDVYNKVHIDRRLFSKIRSDKNYHPSKETVLLLAIALELSEEELDKLLESASYSLPKNNNYDLIIRFCFINKIFKLSSINELLDDYNCKLFSY